MKKIIFICVLHFLITNVLFSQTLFRSEKFKFRIKYPDGWELTKGDGSHVVFKIVDNENASINIVVNEDKQFVGHTIDEYGIDNFVSSIKKSMKSRYSDYEIIDYYLTYLDNQPTYCIISKGIYKTLDFLCIFEMIQYQTIKGKYIYTITAGIDSELFSSYESTFKSIIATFVFEDY